MPERAQRGRLELGVLDDGPPERPGVRDDDPDLHTRRNYARLGTVRHSARQSTAGSGQNDRHDACHTTTAPSCAARARPRRRSGLWGQRQGHGDAADVSRDDDGEHAATPPAPTGSSQDIEEGHAHDGHPQPRSAPPDQDQALRPDTGRGPLRQGRRARRPDIVLGGPQPQPADPRHDAAEGRQPRRSSRSGRRWTSSGS